MEMERWKLLNLKNVMDRRGVTVTKLAEVAGIDQSAMSTRINMRGYGDFTNEQKEVIAKYLGEPKIEWLFTPVKIEPVEV